MSELNIYIYVYPIIPISAHQISTLKPGYNGNKTKQRNTAFKKIKTLIKQYKWLFCNFQIDSIT